MSMLSYFKKMKAYKKLKRKKKLAAYRRAHIIIEARKAHERNRKKLAESLSSGGYTQVKTMQQEDLGFAVAYGVTQAIIHAGNRIEKLKARQRKLSRSKQTHMNRLKKARKKMQSRSRA